MTEHVLSLHVVLQSLIIKSTESEINPRSLNIKCAMSEHKSAKSIIRLQSLNIRLQSQKIRLHSLIIRRLQSLKIRLQSVNIRLQKLNISLQNLNIRYKSLNKKPAK